MRLWLQGIEMIGPTPCVKAWRIDLEAQEHKTQEREKWDKIVLVYIFHICVQTEGNMIIQWPTNLTAFEFC